MDERYLRYSDEARRVLRLARDEAVGLGHNYVGTEHRLLGLLGSGEGAPARALAAVRAAVEEHGPAFVAGWSLVRIPGRGEWTTLAEGRVLVERALAETAPKNGRGRSGRRPTVSA